MKKSYYVNKVEDKLLIKVTKLNKNLNIIKDLRQIRASIRDYFNMKKIHAQIIFVNKKIKIFNFFLKEFTLFEISIQFNMLKTLDNEL